jgi:hypothetical protein
MPNPSIVQKAFLQELDPDSNPSVAFPGSVTKGHYLVAIQRWQESGGPPATVEDSRVNIWAAFYVDASTGMWIATAKDSGACTITTHNNTGGFTYHSDLIILEIDSAGASVFSNHNKGSGADATITNGGVTVDRHLVGFPSSVVDWWAGMLNFNNTDGLAADGLTIAIFMSELGFTGGGPPVGWSDVMTGTGFASTYTEVLVGPGDVGTPPPPLPGVPSTTTCPATCQTNLSDINPPAPAAGVNVRWQKSTAYLDPNNPQESIRDVSAYVDKATLLGQGDQIDINGTPVSSDYIITINSAVKVNGSQLWP